MTEKILGYILLAVGLMIIFGSAFSAYLVFTKKAEPIALFNFPGIKIDPAALQPELPDNIPSEMQQLVNQQTASKPMEIVPPEILNDSSNLFAHLILMGFLVSVGGKIGQLGTYLVRPLIVNIKGKSEAEKVS